LESEVIIEEFSGKVDQGFIAYAMQAISGSKVEQIGASVHISSIARIIGDYVFDPMKVAFIAKVDGNVVGFFLGHANDFHFTDTLVAHETYQWVLPEYRKRGIGAKMLKRFEHWAKEKGCRAISFGVDTTVDADVLSAEKMLLSSGYSLFEKRFRKVI
jgi:GNAT superfamily N-acetyltransferase